MLSPPGNNHSSCVSPGTGRKPGFGLDGLFALELAADLSSLEGVACRDVVRVEAHPGKDGGIR